MNERIRQLVAEAFFDETADASDTKIYKLNDAQMQKFAELIVQECVGVCEEYHGTAGDQAAQYIGQGIKEHFGVEE